MTDQPPEHTDEMSPSASAPLPAPTADTTAAQSRTTVTLVRWWIAALTFVGGLLLGVLAAAVLLATTPTFGTGAGQADPPAPDQQPSNVANVPVVAEARVNAACLRVINEAQDVVRILSGVDDAVTDVDLQRLDDIVRRLQPVESRLQRDLRECRVDTSVSTQSTQAPSSPVPTMPQPSTPR